MKQIISIEKNTDLVADKILCEWGEKHCCIAEWSSAQNSLKSLEYFHFPVNTTGVITGLIDKLKSLANSGDNIFFSSAFAQSLLVPAKLYKQDEQYIKPLYNEESVQLTDKIEQWQLVNVYGIPRVLHHQVVEHFPAACFMHTYSAGLNVYNGYIANDSLSIHFTPYNFSATVKKGGKLQLVQMYPYQTPLDVVYYMLKITEELELPKTDLSVLISGLIEESSALYDEINNYFQNVEFAKIPSIVNQAFYPAHYFTSVYNISACAS